MELLQRALDREHPPARMTATQAADCLGFEKDDLALLAREGLLKPLGRPAANATKYYAATDVTGLWNDRKRLDRATDLLYERNRSKVELQRTRGLPGGSPSMN
jgi:hypothetical protein